MVTMTDPTRAFSSVIPNRRAQRAEEIANRFRLDLTGVDCGNKGEASHARVLIGASARALKPDMVEDTVRIIGMAGGLLADLGFVSCPIGADTTAEPPVFVVWVCGDETESDEFIELQAIGAPGLSLGSCVDGMEGWGFLDSDEFDDRRWFTQRFVDEVVLLVDSLPDPRLVGFDPSDPARVKQGSNEPPRTTPDDPGSASRRPSPDQDKHGRSRTPHHRPGPRSSGS